MLFIDGTFGFLQATDGNGYAETYRLMLPLIAMVRRLNIAAIAVRHVRNSKGAAMDVGIGSTGYAALGRSTVSIAIDATDTSGARRLFAHAGINSAKKASTIAFTIVDGIAIPGFTARVGTLAWGEDVDASADEMIGEIKPRYTATRERNAPRRRSARRRDTDRGGA